MATCKSRGFTELDRADRIYINWDVTGVAGTDAADVSLEGGPFWPMAIGTNQVQGYFAGPDFPSPGAAHVVTATSHAVIRISNGTISETFDGGFIQLVP